MSTERIFVFLVEVIQGNERYDVENFHLDTLFMDKKEISLVLEKKFKGKSVVFLLDDFVKKLNKDDVDDSLYWMGFVGPLSAVNNIGYRVKWDGEGYSQNVYNLDEIVSMFNDEYLSCVFLKPSCQKSETRVGLYA